MSQSVPISVVDLFCGAGGLTHGFILEDLSVVAGIDLDPSCKYPYEKNNTGAKFVQADVERLPGEEVAALYSASSVRVLAGCAPCQPFSTYRQGHDASKDGRWGLLLSFGRLIGEILPEIATMENVPQLSKHSVYTDFEKTLRRLGYHVSAHEAYCPDYGVPQRRRRLVVMASRLGPIRLEDGTFDPSSYRTVRTAIGDQPEVRAGQGSESDPLHKASGMSEVNLRRIRASKPGKTWRDWEESLVAECHRRENGRTYPGVYGRMEWGAPAPTITTECYAFGSGRFGHPEQDRAISLREAALLQTFPRSYEFVAPGEPVHFKRIGRLVGNAVPVDLARAIARSIRNHVEAHSDR